MEDKRLVVDKGQGERTICFAKIRATLRTLGLEKFIGFVVKKLLTSD